ncbi:MAG: HAMP domain-containing sensor histidine kinase [Blastocatellia bacterium]|nr:HAMP domain-containing sensor histidine kinase [Blastocatellia bacterium]
MQVRVSLFTRILLWFFLNLVILGIVVFAFFNLHFRLDPDSPLLGDPGTRIENVARAITDDVRDKTREERDAILQRYSSEYGLTFTIHANSSGERLSGPETSLPVEVMHRIRARPPMAGPQSGRPPRPFPVFTLRTSAPTRYWAGVRIPLHEAGQSDPVRATLLASSDSMTGHGLFFNPRPWLLIAAVVFGLSILLWAPFVRRLTKSIRQLTSAAEQIAEEHFDVRVDERRTDELGRLARSINHLAARLDGFVTGQKRFLGDISHELNSPLARMQFALGILEERLPPAQQPSLEDVREEVQLMTRLVAELLAYSRAGMKTSPIRLDPVRLRPLIEQIVAREAAGHPVEIDVDDSLEALAHPDLLARALANVIRNAVRYAGASGPIEITAVPDGDQIRLTLADHGPGVPDDALDRLFDPFFRLEPDRARDTGGAGLGLAIVKTCLDACQGTVSARNRSPHGLEIQFLMRTERS